MPAKKATTKRATTTPTTQPHSDPLAEDLTTANTPEQEPESDYELPITATSTKKRPTAATEISFKDLKNDPSYANFDAKSLPAYKKDEPTPDTLIPWLDSVITGLEVSKVPQSCWIAVLTPCMDESKALKDMLQDFAAETDVNTIEAWEEFVLLLQEAYFPSGRRHYYMNQYQNYRPGPNATLHSVALHLKRTITALQLGSTDQEKLMFLGFFPSVVLSKIKLYHPDLEERSMIGIMTIFTRLGREQNYWNFTDQPKPNHKVPKSDRSEDHQDSGNAEGGRNKNKHKNKKFKSLSIEEKRQIWVDKGHPPCRNCKRQKRSDRESDHAEIDCPRRNSQSKQPFHRSGAFQPTSHSHSPQISDNQTLPRGGASQYGKRRRIFPVCIDSLLY